MKKPAKQRAHICTKPFIDWLPQPTTGLADHIAWHGTCYGCGRQVYELYTQEPELYDAETNKPVVSSWG